jgi:hypothetical protein
VHSLPALDGHPVPPAATGEAKRIQIPKTNDSHIAILKVQQMGLKNGATEEDICKLNSLPQSFNHPKN